MDDEILEDKKIELISDPNQPQFATVIFTDEDHTIGNSLRYMLMKNSNVDFAGYSIPHPSVNKLNMRIQTTGQPAVEALDKSLRDLKELNEHVLATFKHEFASYIQRN
jgi:DNA-directed RNA polymerase I and III subunit RPAC2